MALTHTDQTTTINTDIISIMLDMQQQIIQAGGAKETASGQTLPAILSAGVSNPTYGQAVCRLRYPYPVCLARLAQQRDSTPLSMLPYTYYMHPTSIIYMRSLSAYSVYSLRPQYHGTARNGPRGIVLTMLSLPPSLGI